MNARSAAQWGLCIGANFRAVSLSAALVLLLGGCGRGPSGDELVSQTKRILLEASLGCTIDVTFNGIGEGDADNAYAAIRLETGPASDRRSTDVEVLVSDWKSDHWEIQQDDATRLVDAANQLCKN
ncbi:hypothetical protein [Pseudoxanthomonas wuyuanensis]|uniref:hypothetical protein n=1 Tax=Pseudoxanthomonas wuyuanensis TaxID=1073196 RepID=UPI001143E9BB|nr:hypothetical protein [Pseudoxanthomonas wuyuanensis]